MNKTMIRLVQSDIMVKKILIFAGVIRGSRIENKERIDSCSIKMRRNRILKTTPNPVWKASKSIL